MFCTHCGQQLPEDALFCTGCGARLDGAAAAPAPEPAAPVSPFAPPPAPEAFAEQTNDAQQAWQAVPQPELQQPEMQQVLAEPVQARKKRGKGLWIGLGCLLLAALVAGGIWFLNRKSTRDNPVEKLSNPAENSYAALSDYLEELPNLHSILKNAQALKDADSLCFAMEFSSVSAFDGFDGTARSNAVGGNLELCRDRENRQLLLRGRVRVNELEIPLNLYLDPRQLQLALPGLLREDEVLALPLEDLPARWNASALAELLDLELPEELDLSGLTETDTEKSLRALYGPDWDRFYDSIQVVPYEGASHFEGSGETLTLSWDKEALKAMTDKTSEEDIERELAALEDLNGLDLGALRAKSTVRLLGLLEKDLKEIQFYKEQDMLTGVYGVTEGSFELRLCGEQNPWERITVKAVDEEGRAEEAEIRLVKGGGQLRLEVSHTVNGEKVGLSSEYSAWNEGAIVYNDADGRITAEGDAFLSMGEDRPELRLLPVEGGFTLRLRQGEEDGDPRDEDAALSQSDGVGQVFRSVLDGVRVDAALTLRSGTEPIRALSAEPTDLLSLSQTQLQGLLLRIASKFRSLTEGE